MFECRKLINCAIVKLLTETETFPFYFILLPFILLILLFGKID